MSAAAYTPTVRQYTPCPTALGGTGLNNRAVTCTAVLAAAVTGAAASARAQRGDLFDLSIEELGQLRVTSVSRRPEPVNDAPAAIHVITADDIRRAGVTSVPEALRLAPGVEVARNGAHSWTIAIRGFNRDLSNKLLVLVDGRSVYSPLYAGVFWDAQDTLLEDIERIEVIAGPGGSLWGANAVNGVVNIITRTAWETQGGFVRAGSGTQRRVEAGARYGGTVGERLAARGYVKYFDHDASATPLGGDAFDDWRFAQGGFRMDFAPSTEAQFTLQGDAYTGEESALVRGDFMLGTLPETGIKGTIDIAGHNLLAAWQRRSASGSTLSVQAYVDHTERDIPGSFGERRDTFDLDVQHHVSAGTRHEIVWGAGYRVTEDELDNTAFATFTPARRTDRTVSAFIQDEIAVAERLHVTLGSKWERNDYTGTEVQPTARLSWLLGESRTFWAAVSRAVRIPARLEEDLALTAPIDLPQFDVPFYARVVGNHAFEAEEMLARELGYRFRVGGSWSFDLAVFDNAYDKLQTNEAGTLSVVEGPLPYAFLPLRLDNGMRGDSRGGTVVANWQARENWRLQFQYAYLDIDLELKPGSADQNSLALAGNSPQDQAAVYSNFELPRDLSLHAAIRYVDELPSLAVPSYTAVDLSLGWAPEPAWNASLTVRNLNDERHVEFGGGNAIERSLYLELRRHF